MNNPFQIFNSPIFGQVRAAYIDGVAWFVGNDVARALGYIRSDMAVKRHVAEEDKKKMLVHILHETNQCMKSIRRYTFIINESGLYSLVLASQLPAAQDFKHWIIEEVIKNGGKTLLPLADNALQVFNHPYFGNLRVVVINNEPFFIGKDVAVSLGYANPERAIRDYVDASDKRGDKIVTPGGVQNTTLINKSGMYSLILDSQMPKAKEYRHWVTIEILPQVDEKGYYVKESAQHVAEQPDFERAQFLAQFVPLLPQDDALPLVKEIVKLTLGRNIF